jgi:mono/diheme cytochrome c family protein
MKDAVDNKDPYDFCWALLEIARLEWRDKGKFETLSTTDIKNILQAIMSASSAKEQDKETKATIHDIKQYLK